MSAIKDKFLILFEQQEGKCLACGKQLKHDASDAEPCLDGDLEITGLLCRHCKEMEVEADNLISKGFHSELPKNSLRSCFEALSKRDRMRI